MNFIPSFDPIGFPAPLWILLALKVFGFWLHTIFMNLWFAGFLVGLLLLFQNNSLRILGEKLTKGMPIFIAFGVNAGIVPLLFTQVIYPQFFYTSSILQGWFWLSVIPLVLLAYYLAYIYSTNIGENNRKLPLAAGWISTAIFLFIGLIFTSQFQFMTEPDKWRLVPFGPGGSVKGLYLSVSSASFQRYFIMFGLALSTTAAYIAFYSSLLHKGGEIKLEETGQIVFALSLLGIASFGTGSLRYLPKISQFFGSLSVFKYLAGVGPLLTLIGATIYLIKQNKVTALLITGIQLLSLLFNAIARQIVQYYELLRYFDPKKATLRLQLSPVLIFIIFFAAGILLSALLLTKFHRASNRTV